MAHPGQVAIGAALTSAESGASRSSYGQILRSSSIVGGASLAQVAIGLLRMKFAALVLGAAGIGLIGLFSSFVLTAGTAASLGVGNSGTRQIARERVRSGASGEAAVRRAIALTTLFLATTGALLVWLFRQSIAKFALGNPSFSNAVGWLALGVALTVVGSTQMALLAGFRRMSAIGWTLVCGSFVATAAATGAIYVFGASAVVFFVIALPLGNVIAAAWFVALLPRSQAQVSLKLVAFQSRQLVSLGATIMFGQLLASAAPLAVRSLIGRSLGLEELGLFNGAWAISMTYLSVVLLAMSADYYPRLSEAVHDSRAATRIVNEQMEVALILAGPIIVLGIGFAPLGLDLLYSSAFRPAAGLLRWQMLGDIFKVASWPLGYALLAANRGRTFVLFEAIVWGAFVAATWLLLPRFGIEAAGVSFFLVYLIYLPLVFASARKVIGFEWSHASRKQLLIVAGGASLVFASAFFTPIAAMLLAVVVAGGLTVIGARKLRIRTNEARQPPTNHPHEA